MRTGTESFSGRHRMQECDACARAVSTAVGYTLILAIMTLLMGGLLMGASSMIREQRTQTARTELRVIGQQIAADIQAVDRLIRGGGTNTSVELTRSLPETVVGSSYIIRTTNPTDPRLELEASNLDVTERVRLTTQVNISSGAITGGDVTIVYNRTSDAIEVQEDRA